MGLSAALAHRTGQRSGAYPGSLSGHQVADIRPFRFGSQSFQSTWPEVLSEGRKAEAQGYHLFAMPDHLLSSLPPIPTLATLANHIGTRLGTYVLCNDFRHPVVMAKEAATLERIKRGPFRARPRSGVVHARVHDGRDPFRLWAQPVRASH